MSADASGVVRAGEEGVVRHLEDARGEWLASARS